MNVLILAAGSSEHFERAGYSYPKNLVETAGKPVIQHVIENVALPESNLIVALRKDEIARFHTDSVVKLIAPGAKIVSAATPTSGAACTALLAVEHIDNDSPLLIVNGDQMLLADHNAMINHFTTRNLDGGLPVFEDVHPKYSFVKLDSNGFVIETAEKRPISKLATAGRYYFHSGNLFVRCVKQMMLKDAHVGGLFYVCPAYNQAILANAAIGVYPVLRRQYVSLNTPQAVNEFSSALISNYSITK